MPEQIDDVAVQLYGEDVYDNILKEYNEMKSKSNIPFDQKYINLGMSFLKMKMEEISQGKKAKPSIKSLVNESFGEAAIYKYNVNGGTL